MTIEILSKKNVGVISRVYNGTLILFFSHLQEIRCMPKTGHSLPCINKGLLSTVIYVSVIHSWTPVMTSVLCIYLGQYAHNAIANTTVINTVVVNSGRLQQTEAKSTTN